VLSFLYFSLSNIGWLHWITDRYLFSAFGSCELGLQTWCCFITIICLWSILLYSHEGRMASQHLCNTKFTIQSPKRICSDTIRFWSRPAWINKAIQYQIKRKSSRSICAVTAHKMSQLCNSLTWLSFGSRGSGKTLEIQNPSGTQEIHHWWINLQMFLHELIDFEHVKFGDLNDLNSSVDPYISRTNSVTQKHVIPRILILNCTLKSLKRVQLTATKRKQCFCDNTVTQVKKNHWLVVSTHSFSQLSYVSSTVSWIIVAQLRLDLS